MWTIHQQEENLYQLAMIKLSEYSLLTNTIAGACCFVFLNHNLFNQNPTNHICGVMVSVLASSAVDRGFKPQSGQTNDNASPIMHAALRSKSKDWMARVD